MSEEQDQSCTERLGNKVDQGLASFFQRIGTFVANRPKTTLACTILLAVICGGGVATLETENRPEELWVPQDTIAETEEAVYRNHFPPSARINQVIISAAENGDNILTKASLLQAMQMHNAIEQGTATYEDEDYMLTDLCVPAGGSCVDPSAGGPVCSCLVNSILKQWNYDMETLENDDNVLSTLNNYGTQEDLSGVLGNPVFDQDGQLVSAEAFSLSYFLFSRAVEEDGSVQDPINEQWELDVFLETVDEKGDNYDALELDYFSSRSFGDEFGGAITGDLLYVQVSYIISFVFLGATLGRFRCGPGSRWAMSFAALCLVGLSTIAGFGISSLCGLFFGPVHSLLPFILLGIGVDDAFVITNAINRERKNPRKGEEDEHLIKRCAKGLSKSGTSITVTSATDLVAFAISSSSALPALASFCAYAAISIFFLWFFAATFYTACLVQDEKRQRDNRRDLLCCIQRKQEPEEDVAFEENMLSRYFRNYHAPAILSQVGKICVLLIFSGLLGFGFYGTLNLTVEDTERQFIPAGSYLNGYLDAADEYFPDSGINLFVVFEEGDRIYENRVELAALNERVSGLSEKSPYIAEPNSEDTYQNVMTGLSTYLQTAGSGAIGNVTLGDDGWPQNEEDFYLTMGLYANVTGPGALYAQDVSYAADGKTVEAIRVQLEYVRLTKLQRGEIIDDADRQIDAMDDTRAMINGWEDLQPATPYSEKFLTIEGFKIIQQELFRNVGLAIACVFVIVLLTVANIVAAFLITINVGFCIIEILGFMYAAGIVIDSVSVINIVLAVGLSVDYSAHVGHCFMVKGGKDKDRRALESLADIGAAVLNGAMSTFLAVAVLLASTSYVFQTLSIQFALTVFLGVSHGLILLPVLLSLLGPAPFTSAEPLDEAEDSPKVPNPTEHGDFENGSDE